MVLLPDRMDNLFSPKCVWVNGPIIVGAGPSGLVLAASLHEQRVPFVILEHEDCIASLWQKRTYDRLKLHLPKQFCQLPQMPFLADFPEYPTRQQFINYLETCAAAFDVKPMFGSTVKSVCYDQTSELWSVHSSSAASGEIEYRSRWVVVATGENAEKVVPHILGLDDFTDEVTHVSEYKSGEKYKGKRVLVISSGDFCSGMEVSLDLCDNGAFPSMVVRDAVHVLPCEVLRKSTFELAMLLMAWLPLWSVDKIMVFLSWLTLGNLHHFSIRHPAIGPLTLKNIYGRTPVLDTGAVLKIRSDEITIVPGVTRFAKNRVELTDGMALDIDAVVMAIGYWSNVPQLLQGADLFGKDGYPKTVFPHGWKGQSGLYSVGFTVRGLSWASADAVRISKHLGQVWREETEPTTKRAAGGCHCWRISIIF